MKYIKKVKIHNFGRYRDLTIEFNETLNLFIGDNESGKSTILSAIDIVLSGSRNKVETFGLDSLFNTGVVTEFLRTEKKIEDLPVLYVEVYLNNFNKKELDGRYNSLNEPSHGMMLFCDPSDDLSGEIKEILNQEEDNFPFEFYNISFKTFSGESYTGYRKFIHHLLLDNTQINNEYATRSYIKTIYHKNANDAERNKHHNEYRKRKNDFGQTVLSDLNSRIEDYTFSVRTSSKSNLETDLTIKEEDIEIENKGKGRQCFIRTDFALQRRENDLDVILIEEPENHLSHINMKKLITRISDTDNKQLFIATHNNLISTRLNLKKSVLLSSSNTDPLQLNQLSPDTAKFFMKSPDNNILEYILSKKVILVEGSAEYILMEEFYKKVTNENLELSDIHIISIGGTSFKRYLDIARLLRVRTAVIRDNDGNYQANIVDGFSDYSESFIKIFSNPDDSLSTFEIIFYKDNKVICDELFSESRRSLTVQDFMLSNKADCAFNILEKKSDSIKVPNYVKKTIEWIRE